MALIQVVMGVSGSGKSTVGKALAAARGVTYLEGDDFHPPRNVERMAAGIALTDEDRAGWLLRLRDELGRYASQGRGVVLACSALKRDYRDVLRQGAPHLQLIYLHGSRELLAQRLAERRHHYMPASLLDSQLATLEVPQRDEAGLIVDVDRTPEEIVRDILARQTTQTKQADDDAMTTFTKTVLYTGDDGRARFREEPVELNQGTPQSRLSAVFGCGGYQLRHSPVGFASDFHCTGTPQWVFILRGRMQIELRDGSTRTFEPGQHFYSADTLPPGARFDADLHGHRSRQCGDEPLLTLFVKD